MAKNYRVVFINTKTGERRKLREIFRTKKAAREFAERFNYAMMFSSGRAEVVEE